MDIRLRVPDDLADDYDKHGLPLEAALLATLLRFRKITPTDRAFIVSHEDRGKLEALLGSGHIMTSKDLRERVERLARLRVGDIEIPFSSSEWREIELRASKRGITVEDECRQIVKKMHELFFNIT
jgi:hypothetical protein